MSSSPDRILVGEVTGVHGIRGRLKVLTFTETPEAFAELQGVITSEGEPAELKLTSTQGNVAIMEMTGLTRREQAEALIGQQFFVERETLKPATENSFYIHDLKDLPVINVRGKSVGTINGCFNFGAGDIVEIRFRDGKTEMYPFTNAIFPVVDVAAKRVVIDQPEEVWDRPEK